MIVQLIPAHGWFAFSEEDGEDYYRPLVAWGLTDEGETIGLVTDYDEVVGAVDHARIIGGKWLGYVQMRDTPEGQRRQQKLRDLEDSLDTPDPVRQVTALTLAMVDGADEAESDGDGI